MADRRVVVIGAGPHALTACSYLLWHRPDLRHRLTVVDPNGWLVEWRRRFHAAGITMLRSHYTDHPHPDPYALWRFSQARLGDRLGVHFTPTEACFADFCASLVGRFGLDRLLLPQLVVRIDPVDGGLDVALSDGTTIPAGRVVLATNAAATTIPDWAQPLLGAPGLGPITHTEHLDIASMSLAGRRVLIVGGGLTAGHLALGAMDRGATVTLACRSDLRIGVFDVAGCWQGPPCLGPFHAETDMAARARALRAARPGGSLTPEVAASLRRAAAEGRLRIIAGPGGQVEGAAWAGGRWTAAVGGAEVEADDIWLATGTTPSVAADPLLSALVAAQSVPVVDGLPRLDRACRWPGIPLHVTGGLAGLQLGPFARNLIGARMAAERIVSDQGDLPRRQYPTGGLSRAMPDRAPAPARTAAPAWHAG